jgi:hypothetical protein
MGWVVPHFHPYSYSSILNNITISIIYIYIYMNPKNGVFCIFLSGYSVYVLSYKKRKPFVFLTSFLIKFNKLNPPKMSFLCLYLLTKMETALFLSFLTLIIKLNLLLSFS